MEDIYETRKEKWPVFTLIVFVALMMECGEGQTDAVSGNAVFGLFYVDSEDPRRGGAKMLYEELQQVKAAMRPGPRLDLDTAHVFCQWQSCLQMGLYLNQLLSTPLPEPNLTWLYNGSLVHRLCQQLLASCSAESLLSICPEARQLYEHLFSATRSYAPAELFLPKATSKSKKRRQKKKIASLGTTSDTKHWYDRSNRFSLLVLESSEEHVENAELE